MKRNISLLLICIMVISMSACSFINYNEKQDMTEPGIPVEDQYQTEPGEVTTNPAEETQNSTIPEESTNNETDVPTETSAPTEITKPEIIEISDEWTDLEFVFDGKYYKLDFSYSDLKNSGWTFDLKDYGKENGYILNKGNKVSSTIDLHHEEYGNKFNSFKISVGFVNNNNDAKDIAECDIWAFGVDTRYGFGEIEKYPEMKIAKGIQFGSAKEDVILAFGEPDEIYESKDNGYVKYTYSNNFSKYMYLTIYEDSGVSAIEFKQY